MLRSLENIRIRLRVGILAMFLLVMLPLTFAMLFVLGFENRHAAAGSASEAATRITEESVTTIRELFTPIVQSLDVSAALAREVGTGVQQPQYLQPMFQTLNGLPHVFSFYYGFDRDGSYLEMVRLPRNMRRFAPYANPPPAAARFAIRRIDRSSPRPLDRISYLVAWGAAAGSDQTADLSYDPRARPWYLAARGTDGVANTGPYRFSSINEVGVTLSRRIVNASGLVGVIGVDVTLDALSDYMARAKVGPHGVIFIVDAEGRVIGQSGGKGRVWDRQGSQSAIADPRIARAMQERADRKTDRFVTELDQPGRLFNVSFSPLPAGYGQGWTVGVAVTPDDFNTHFSRLARITTIVGIIFILIACCAVAAASMLITRPINALIAETDSIRAFELSGGVKIQSHIIEIDALARSLAGMKAALRSFSRFVPKEVVREIVRDRTSAMLGGQRQPLTVMFSDLEKFSLMSEELPPEEVVERLSRYFEAMTKPIHRHNGVVDKFIGDAIMALWNAPVEDPEHVANGCRAVLACRKVGQRLNQNFAEAGIPPMRTRFSLHTGVAVVGKVGSTGRMQFTAFGSMVNLASRVEGMNKFFGTDIMVTGDVEAAVRGQFLFRPFGAVVAAGTRLPFEVFELLGEPGDAKAEARLAAWNRAYAAFVAHDWANAAEGFAAFLAAYPGDDAGLKFLDLCQRLHGDGADWDGALHFDRK